MKTLAIAVVATLSMTTGCSTVKSAASALTGGKPHQVTVVNNITVPAAAPAPVVEQPIVATPHKREGSGMRAVAKGALVGAAIGTVVGYAVGGGAGATKGGALGAGAGAVGGAVANEGN